MAHMKVSFPRESFHPGGRSRIFSIFELLLVVCKHSVCFPAFFLNNFSLLCSGFRNRGLANGVSRSFFTEENRTNGRKTEQREKFRTWKKQQKKDKIWKRTKKTPENGKKEENGNKMEENGKKSEATPFRRPPLVAHDCGYPLSRYTCRATRVAAD